MFNIIIVITMEDSTKSYECENYIQEAIISTRYSAESVCRHDTYNDQWQ